MRITRAAKVAAFPLIVLALVALIACQGPAGVKGAAGTDGTDGAPGAAGVPGSTGQVGPAALAGLKVDAELDNLKDGAASDIVVDLNDYFGGGATPYSFNLKAVPPDDDFVTAKVDGTMLTLKLTIPSGGEFNADGADGFTDGKSVTVVAVDANGATAEGTVTVKPNRAPRPADGVTVNADGEVTNGDLTLGTQDADSARMDGFFDCKKFNECVITIFLDDAKVTRSVTEPATSSNFSWGRNDDGMIVLTGLSTTWVADADDTQDGDQPGDKPIAVKIKVEDSNELSIEATIMVSVNAAPTESKGAGAVVRTLEVGVGSADTGTLTGSPDSLFADTEGDMRTVTFASGNEAVAAVAESTGVVTGVARGAATITATATSDADGLLQTAEVEFSVTVK